jgi:hypothetical protein
MQFSPTSCHSNPLWSKYSPQYLVLEHPQSVPAVLSETKFHKTKGKIIALYILIVMVLDSRQKDKRFQHER